MSLWQQVSETINLIGTDMDLAEEKMRALVIKYPKESAPHLGLGFIYSRQLRYEESLQQLEEASKLEPDNENTHFNIAYTQQQLGNIVIATEHYQLAYHLSQNKYAEVGILWGMSLHQQGQLAQALQVYQQLSKHHHCDPRVWFAYWYALREKNELTLMQQAINKFTNLVFANTGGEQSEAESKQKLTQVIGFFTTYDYQGWQQLDHKASLQICVQRYAKLSDSQRQLCPTTFILPEQYDAFLAYYQAENEAPYWLLKPTGYSGGQGAHIVTKPGEIDRQNGWIIQHYVDKPLLLNGHKFNLRMYLVITQVNAAHIFLWRQGVAFIAPEPFSLAASQLNNKQAHIVNPLMSMGHPKMKIAENYATEKQGNIWRLQTLLAELANEGVNTQLIHQRIIELANQLIGLMQCNDLLLHQRVKNARYAFPVKILGMDLVLTEQLQPLLLEVERFPGLSAPEEDAISNGIKKDLLMDVAKLILPENARKGLNASCEDSIFYSKKQAQLAFFKIQ